MLVAKPEDSIPWLRIHRPVHLQMHNKSLHQQMDADSEALLSNAQLQLLCRPLTVTLAWTLCSCWRSRKLSTALHSNRD